MIARLFMAACVWFFVACDPAAAEHAQSCQGRAYTLPDSYSVVCSASWQFEARCTGEKDMWDSWSVVSQSEPFVRPWLDQPIMVVGYELTKLRHQPGFWRRFREWWRDAPRDEDMSWFMIGSTIAPDPMLYMAPGETHSRQFWPRGLGQLWPSKQAARTDRYGDMIDLHGICFGGGRVTIFLTVYYVPMGDIEGASVSPAK